ncbi:hypothetical protein K1W54_20975 [Micromonospora sp. CPCC 205371]|nr:hypothetical protein [Micromonospora sp. CPCC 205371]
MSVATGRVFSVRLLRWFMVVGALFAVALFSGASYRDAPLAPVSMAGFYAAACPNVVLQASLPGALAAETDGGLPDNHGPGGALAGGCLFVVVALAGLALAGGIRRPLLVHAAFWWARLRVSRMRPMTVVPMWADVLRI